MMISKMSLLPAGWRRGGDSRGEKDKKRPGVAIISLLWWSTTATTISPYGNLLFWQFWSLIGSFLATFGLPSTAVCV